MVYNKPIGEQPVPRQIYIVPLKNGWFGAVRVICPGDNTFSKKTPGWIVAALDKFWKRAPLATDVSRCKGLKQYYWGKLFKGWVELAPPTQFTCLGKIPWAGRVPLKNVSVGTTCYLHWEELADGLFEEWRWRFDKKAFEAELAEEERAEEAKEQELQKTEDHRRKKLTLATFAREKPFVHWANLWPKHVVSHAHEIFRKAALKLIALGKNPDKEKCGAIIKRVVNEFNKLDRDEECIETEERDEVVARIEELAGLCGLDNIDEQLTGHRDW